MTEKLDDKLELNEIKQTRTGRTPRPVIPFRDSAIDKIRRATTAFGPKKYIGYNFDVSKGSSLKGLMLKFYKQSQKKSFVLSFWFNNRNDYYILGSYPNIRCKDVERICLDLAETHQDERGLWLKNPNQTRANEKRLVDKPDSTLTAGKTINEVIEDYCKGGFEKDSKFGNRDSKSCQIWFRYMAGYNKRQSLIEFENNDSGSGVVKFVPNKHLRINAPRDWQDLFRKFPSGSGIKKDRVYYNRRKKHTYTITASENKAIYDTDLGKSLMEELTPGDLEHWLKDVSSSTLKEKYLKVFISLWIWARKKGWLGTNPGECPISLESVYIKKEQKKSDPYKDVAIEDPKILDIFWESCEELSEEFPWVAELHQFLLLTSIRKSEAMKYKKEYIDWDKMTYLVPKGISKTRKINKVQPITPELEILFRNILDIGDRPGLEYYKMKDHIWLFGTTKWSASKYFSKDHKQSHKSHLGTDETFTPKLRALMRYKAEDPDLIYAPKILRKSYITLSQKVHGGRSDITAETSRHEDLTQIKRYNKPGIETRRAWASEVSKHFNFVKRRSA